MNHDEQDDLWELLGKAPPKQARASFAQDVLRAVRMSEPEPEPGFFQWLRHGWNALAAAGAVAVIAAMVLLNHEPQHNAPALASHDTTAIDAALSSSDFTVIGNLDVLLALDDKNPWLDSPLP